MLKKDKVDMERLSLIKALRAAFRLKYSLRADEVINERIPDIVKEFDQAVLEGKPFNFDVAGVFKESY